MNKWRIPLFLFALLLFAACNGRDTGQEPGREEVFAIRDSLRNELLLRLSQAQQEINRRAEAMRNRAYNADRATSRRLNQKISRVEKSYEDLERQTQILLEDSLMGDWRTLQQETERLIIVVSKELEISF